MHSTMKRFSFFLPVFLAFLPAGAQMDTNAPDESAAINAASVLIATNAVTRAMSLQDCLQEALQHNLDVQIQRYNPQISLYDLRADYGGYDPTLSLQGQHRYGVSPSSFNPSQTNQTPPTISDQNSFGPAGNSEISGALPWGLQYDLIGSIAEQYGTQAGAPFDSSSGDVQVQLAQPLLKNFWIDQTRLGIRVARNRLKYSQQGLRNQIIASATAVENAYYELIYAQENVKVQQEALVLAQTLLDQDNQRVQIGTVAERAGTIEQDEAQAAQSQANLIAAQYLLVQDQNSLKNLLADTNYLSWHDIDIQPTAALAALPQSFDLQESWRKGMTERPDLLQARLDVEKQGIQLKFDRNQLFPELDVFGSYGFNGAGREYSGTLGQINEGNAPFYSYGARMTIPLSNLGARNTFKADKLSEKQLLLTLKQLEQKIMVDIDNAVKNAQSTYQGVQASRQARIYAEAALDAEQKKYAVGKSTTFTVLQLQNTLTTDRGLEIRALANYNEALANLAATEGSTLERDRIDLQAK